MRVRDMLEAHRRPSSLDRDLLVSCIEDCIDCAATCTSDADADLAEPDVQEQLRCIRLCLDCADVCAATARVVSRQTAYDAGVVRPLLEACAALCARCGDECEGHAEMHAHCRVCEQACRHCERACRDLLGA